MEYYSKKAAGITPYTPGEQPEKTLIKINTNENPYPPSPAALQAAGEAVGADLRLYSDPESGEVRRAVVEAERAAGTELKPENVFVGFGSDDVLSLCFQAFFPPEGAEELPLLFPDLCYTFYPVYANLYDVKYEAVPVNQRFEILSDDYLKPNAGVVLANPNAPTGIYKPLEEIEPILRYCLHNSLVVVDEAYIAFAGVSAASLVGRYSNLLVVRTLSKSHALAGLRVGYALGHPHLIEGLTRIKNCINPYLDLVAQRMAAAALRDEAYYAGTTARIVATRERVAGRLRDMGFSLLPSATNFLLATHEKADARCLYQGLGEKGIWVRFFAVPRIDNYIRISMGTDEEMDIFLEHMQRLLEA